MPYHHGREPGRLDVWVHFEVWPDFWGCVFEVWPAPGARESLKKVWGAKPPTFLKPAHHWHVPETLNKGTSVQSMVLPAVFRNAFYFSLVKPSPGGSRGGVRAAVFLQKLGFCAGSGGVI